MKRPETGDRISNYILDARIGCGSFGEVWKAHHHIFEEAVAIKIPTDAQYVRNLRHEGVAIHGLDHPNIVRAIDLDPYADQPYLIMEYVDGPSLREILDAHPQGLGMDASVAILTGVLSALDAAGQAGIVHRDIKPANILVAGGNDLTGLTPSRVKVTDFGLGHAVNATAVSIMQSGSLETETGRGIAGTLVYMSPEQREGKPLDPRSDLYACGVVLFEMLTGERPAGTDQPSDVRNGIPPWMDEFFGRLYTRQDRRLASAAEALAVLRRHLGPPLVPPRVATGPLRPPPPPLPPRRCPQCNAQAFAENRFCTRCGASLAAPASACPGCRRPVRPTDQFCIYCGAGLRTRTG
ncbi:MAG: protein kinase [Phycisphaerae bacterium]|nr:protein kinase [Phycisphaerae bacterium]